MDRRTLYNLLRMNWLRDPSISVEPWQVADYRRMTLQELFNALNDKQIFLDRVSFLSLADNVETPEELTDILIAELELHAAEQDQIYLLVFEIWRRLVPEKLCLSVFCDELDYQIDLFDRDKVTDTEELQDTLANLIVILDDNIDLGASPREVFDSISARCANDLETFLYDFIAGQIDDDNELYASELLDSFWPFVDDGKWFEFLKARLIALTNMSKGILLVKKILGELTEQDPEFNLELLSFLVLGHDRELFVSLVKQTLPLLTTEEEFQDLLSICADYLHRSDFDLKEAQIDEILKQRAHLPLTQPLKRSNPPFEKLLNILI